jgi:diguanylate cyclase (GGDEF)-like protein
MIAIGILIGWLFPPVIPFLFSGWALMKANTALLILLTGSSLALSQRRMSFFPAEKRFVASWILAAIVLLIAAAVLAEYFTGIAFGIDTFLAADQGASIAGRMSPQTATAFLLLGTILTCLHLKKRIAGLFTDLLVFCLCTLVMVIVSGYAFGAMRLFGVNSETRTAPHTLIALTLLSFVVFARRIETGSFAVLAGSGVGGQIARVAAPLALIVPFALEVVRYGVARASLLSQNYATALVTALASMMGFAIILALAWRIERLEQNIRDLSLRDELTALYNRRGFFLLAERELRKARRAQTPFSVLFIDIDGLKRVNDTLGHAVGSKFLIETSLLIQACLRESDVAGRIGGDEFVIAGAASEEGFTLALRRLQQAATQRNSEPGHLYSLSFSAGIATSTENNPETLEMLVKRADEAMYSTKHGKQLARS